MTKKKKTFADEMYEESLAVLARQKQEQLAEEQEIESMYLEGGIEKNIDTLITKYVLPKIKGVVKCGGLGVLMILGEPSQKNNLLATAYRKWLRENGFRANIVPIPKREAWGAPSPLSVDIRISW